MFSLSVHNAADEKQKHSQLDGEVWQRRALYILADFYFLETILGEWKSNKNILKK